jgi:uncharacterized repeat protein (TIGR04076 family)
LGKLVITVKEILGSCPLYRTNDRIVLDEGYRLNLEETDNVCMHSLASIPPYYVALYRGVNPKELGLSQGGKKAYVQCLDPCRYAGGGKGPLKSREMKHEDGQYSEIQSI